MRFRYFEPGPNGEHIEVIVTEAEVMQNYYPMWKQRMQDVGKADLISVENCLADFQTVHWAEREE